MAGKYFLYPFREGEVLQFRKNHPCGGRQWVVVRVGAEVLIRCDTCAKSMTVPRSKLEKMCQSVLSGDDKHVGI